MLFVRAGSRVLLGLVAVALIGFGLSRIARSSNRHWRPIERNATVWPRAAA